MSKFRLKWLSLGAGVSLLPALAHAATENLRSDDYVGI